jgi:hypothetical protein
MSDVAGYPMFIHESSRQLIGRSEAVFSEDRAYRYQLSRTWGDESRPVVWIMLNPSTADAMADDPTVRRCAGFAKAWGFASLRVVNLFALRSTDPRGLACADPVGPANDGFILLAAQAGALVIAAWGTHGHLRGRGAQVTRMLGEADISLDCLGVTKDGHPRHPLYVRADAELVPYSAQAVRA